MSNTISVTNKPPEAGASSLEHRKALVVGADYFALTARVDPNVLFWSRKEVLSREEIPQDVTHLWVAPFLFDEASHIFAEAEMRGINVWKVVHSELRRRLLPFWSQAKRSIIDPIELDGEAGAILRTSVFSQPYSVETDDVVGKSELVELQAKRLRLKLLKESSERVRLSRTSPEVNKRKVRARAPRRTDLRLIPVPPKEFKELPDFDRQVMALLYGIGKPRTHSQEEVAEEFGIPLENLRRIITRVLARIGTDWIPKP